MSANQAGNWVESSKTIHLNPINTIQHGSNYFSSDAVIGTGTRRRRWKSNAAVNNSANTFIMGFEAELPRSFVPGTYTVVVSANVDVNPNVTQNLDALLWKMANDGITTGSDLVSTSAQAITNAAADYSFTVDLSGLVAGEKIFLELQAILDNTGGSGDKFAFINSVRLTGLASGGVWA